MAEPWSMDDDVYRRAIAARDRVQSNDVGLADIPYQRSLLNDGANLVEDIELMAPGAQSSRNLKIQVDIEDRISGSLSPKINTRHLRTAVIAATLVTLSGLGWLAGSRLNLFEGKPVSTPDVQVAPPFSNHADAGEAKSIQSNLTAPATPAPVDDIATLLKKEKSRSENSVRALKGKPSRAPELTAADRVEMPRRPVPETRPTTIEGWSVRDVLGSTAVLEGPTGVWNATRGDTVPGVGKINSIVRWGDRWLVATCQSPKNHSN